MGHRFVSVVLVIINFVKVVAITFLFQLVLMIVCHLFMLYPLAP